MKNLNYFAFNRIIRQKVAPDKVEHQVGADAVGEVQVKLLPMVKPPSLAGKTFEAVAVHGVLERPFRHDHQNAVHLHFVGNGGEIVKAAIGIERNFLLFVEQPLNGQFGADAFLFGESKMLFVSVFWLHIPSRKCPLPP